MSKAYDRTKWSFIEVVMCKMGFSEIWITWIMRCITSVQYTVLINGQPRGNIIPGRGLRQGDPLSPFIFILCKEALVCLLNHADNQGKITRMCVTCACPSVSHLLFADDSLFFCNAEPRECEEVMKVARVYGKASGQCINFDKSSLLFGKRINAITRQECKDALAIQNEGDMEIYIWVSQKILVAQNANCSLSSRINWCIEWMDGHVDGSRKEERKCWSYPFYLLSRHMLCPLSCSHWRYVKTLPAPLHNFGGVRIHQKEEFTGRNGKKSVYLERRVGFDFVWSMSSIWHYWQNNYGG